MEYIFTTIHDFFVILCKMAPYLLLGFLFAGLLYAFIPQRKIERYFGGSPFKSSVLASLFGIPLPLCSCGVIPTGIAFYKNGASKSGTVSFLISTPQTGVDSILASFSLLGLPFAIIRPIAALLTGITGGIITGFVTENEKKKEKSIEQNQEQKTFSQKVKDVFKYGFVDFIQDISKWLVIGLALAALISALIPNDFFNLIDISPIYQMLLILLVSIPLYICATGSIPLAAILILKGISPGAAFVLLMAGPATNAATITMISKVLGKKTLFAYLASIILGALSFGLIIDYALPTEWFTQITQQNLGHNHNHLAWWEIASGILLVALIINGYIKTKFKSKEQTNVNIMDTVTIKVDGMTCNHCKANVEKNLEKLPFVASAEVDLSTKSVCIKGEHPDVEKLKETIDSIGYEVIE